MPTVPYNPIPQAKPTEAGTPEVQVQTPIAAFGGTVAHALEGFGKNVEHAGDEIFRQAIVLQNQANETEAKNADSWYMEEAGKLHAKFNSLEGNDAVKAYPKYIKDLEETRISIRKGLSNDMVRKMYDGPSLSFYGRSVFNGAGVAASAAKKAASDASQARVDMLTNAAGASPSDDIGFTRGLTAAEDEVRSQGRLHGWSPEVTQNVTQKVNSQMKAARITGLARTEPMAAMQMFKDYGPDLTVADRQRVEGVVYGRVAQVAGRNEADTILAPTLGTDKQKPLKDYLEEGRTAVEKMRIEDESLRVEIKNRVDGYITAKYNQQEHAKVDQQRIDISTINNALVPAADGTIPRSVDEVFAKPGVQEAYNRLSGTPKKQVFDSIVRAVSRKARFDDQTSWRSMDRLNGMANDERTVNEFLNVDPWDPQYKMNPAEIHKIIKLQDQKRKDPTTDPVLKKAIGLLQRVKGAELRELGITTKADNPDRYDEFTGTLFTMIRDFQEQNKRNPTEDEILDRADKLMFRPPATGFPRNLFPSTWSWGKGQAMMQEPVPEEFATTIRNQAYARGQPAPTDREMKQIYIRERLRNIYGNARK